MGLDLNAYVKKVTITDTKGKLHYLTGESPEAQLQGINIYESMDLGTMVAELFVIDTAINLIATAPIVGTETVEIEMVSPNISDKSYKWNFVIYAIRNRVVSKNVQVYVLDCFSVEALRNETLRVSNTMTGPADTLVKQILSEVIETKKDYKTNIEACAYPIKYIPSLQRPFDVIDSFLHRSISKNSSNSIGSTSTSSIATSSGTTSDVAGGQTAAATAKSATTISGSAGYKFFETYDGYVFKSIDLLMKENVNKHKEYVYGMAQDNQSTSEKNSYLILNYSFGSQENILQKMRTGVYSSMISFFNPSTCEYEEYFFDLSKEYPKMIHLGTDNTIPDNIKKLANYPSRVMLQVYDHETYYNGIEIADPKTSPSATPFPDYSKQWMAQSISRSVILKNQILNITIPINFEIRAGDKLNVKLPNQSVSSKREQEKYDLVNSGLYLVNNIAYNIIRDTEKGLVAVCNIELIRDNLGSK